MRISIVTPSYNHGAFIAKTIASVKSQAGVSIEHIILDNCSTDETGRILREYEENPEGVSVKVIVERDGGQTGAINRGFLMATGDVVCWLNADEYLEPGALSVVGHYFSKSPRIDILFGDFSYVDSEGRLLKVRKCYDYSENMLLYYGCYIPSCSTFINRRIIDDGHLLDVNYRVTMDFEYYLRLAYLGYQFVHVDQVLAQFTLNDSNISVKEVSRRIVERRMVIDYYSRLPSNQTLRSLMYMVFKWYWIFFRVLRRILREKVPTLRFRSDGTPT